jgi:ABC-type branched-subunit amino acid transport system permease subunit
MAAITSEPVDVATIPGWVAPVAILIAAFGIVPYLGSNYLIEAIMMPFLALSLAGVGLNLLTGYAGQVSLGSAAFMAVGAFAAFNLNLRVDGLPLVVSIVLAGGVAAAIGIVFGLPSLRLRGFYLAVSTLAAQFFVQWALTKFGWFSNDNPSGVIDAPALSISGVPFEGSIGRYYFALIIVSVLTFLAWRIATSQTGRNFIAVRDNETAAKFIGVPVLRTKLLAFALSSFIIGVADGGTGGLQSRPLVPDPLHHHHRRTGHDPRRLFRCCADRDLPRGSLTARHLPARGCVRLRSARHEPAYRARRADHCLPDPRTRWAGRARPAPLVAARSENWVTLRGVSPAEPTHSTLDIIGTGHRADQ